MSQPGLTEGMAETADRLLEESWGDDDRRLDRRGLLAESGLTIAFLLASFVLLLIWPAHDIPVGTAVALGVAYALASRVEFPIGAGHAVPTEIFLIPMLLLLPPTIVPLVVLGALALASFTDWMRGRSRIERILETGGDAWHCIGPVVVFAAAGAPGPTEAPWWLYLVAFAAQVAVEVVAGTLREWLSLGLSPELQLRVLAIVWAIDIMLLPVGIIGALAADAFTPAPLALLGVAAVLALLARDRNQRIDQAHERLEALQRERRRLQVAVHRIGDAFASKLDLDALLSITTRAAVEAIDADGGRAGAHQGLGRRLVRRATVHEDADLEPALRAAEEGALDREDPSVAMVDGVWALASPVKAPDSARAAGMISVARRGSAFLGEERDLLIHLCEQAGVAAANIDKHETLHRQALTDELTGLANHRRLQELLTQGVERYHRSQVPLSFVLLDLDDFKAVNDSRGHQTGDIVLRAVADALRECCRADDEPARYGGEELGVVLQGVDFSQAIALAERVRAAVAALELVDTEGEKLSVTTSVGVASLGAEVPDGQALIAAADQALYQAKRDGKNCVRYGTIRTDGDYPHLRLA
ncbi:MAG: sensor domain-containing diguanylate cyclase [Solirubrobacteraceae bacterium]|nr:sensor domain-containing diguanylate cyclase [Solirubrobacteraceae bacterium]